MLPDVDELPSPGRRRALFAAAGLVGTVALWQLLATVLSSDRGIDLTDEGLYVLAADPPSRNAAWLVPWGWHTRPLFRLAGFDLAALRTLAALIIVLAGAVLGWTLARLVRQAAPFEGRLHSSIVSGALIGVGAFGAPMLMASMLRTPGYNWVNLTGITVTAIGALSAAAIDDPSSLWRSPRAHASAALLAMGATFTIPAKPTSGPLVLVAALIVLVPRFGWRACLRLAGMVTAWIATTVVVLLALRIWPIDFLTTLRESTRFPIPTNNQTPSGAVDAVLHLPETIWNAFGDLPALTIWIIVASTIAALALRFTPRTRWWMRCAPLLLMAVAALGVTGPWPHLGAAHPTGRYVWVGTSNGAVLLLLGALLHLLANWSPEARHIRRRLLPVALFLLLTAVIYAFGSGTGLYRQMGLATMLLWLAAACVAVAGARRDTHHVALGIMVLVSMVISVGTVIDSRNHPYRGVDLADQTTPYRMGARGIDLLVDEPTATFLTSLRTGAEAGGWCDGTPLIGLAWRWSSTVPYSLGARVPETLMFTLFGYEGSAKVAEYSLAKADPAVWRDAWLLTTDPATIKSAFAANLRSVLDLLPATTGRAFPAGYTVVADVDGTQLWRPSEAANTCGAVSP